MKLKEKTIKTNMTTINVATTGTGEPVLCLAGFGCDHYIFLSMAPTLSEKFELIMPDNRGMGKSGKTTSPYTLEDVANDALEVMDQLGHKKFHVIGISMGGFLSQLVAQKAPEKILSLSLLCTLGVGDDFIPIPLLDDKTLTGFYTAQPELVIPAAVGLTTHPSTDKTIINHIIKTRLEHHEQLDEILRQRDAVVAFFENSKVEYEKFNFPVLCMIGSEDRFVNPKNASILFRKFRNSKLIMVDNTDHYFFMEKPEVVSQHILDFYSQEVSS